MHCTWVRDENSIPNNIQHCTCAASQAAAKGKAGQSPLNASSNPHILLQL